MQYSPDQTIALSAIESWHKTGGQMFQLGGAAGCGKTTLAQAALDRLGLKPFSNAKFWTEMRSGNPQPQEGTYVCGTPTRRAAGVLTRKGVRGARTVHSLAYSPWVNLTPEIKREIAALEREISSIEGQIDQVIEAEGEDAPKALKATRQMFRLIDRVDKLKQPDFSFNPALIECASLLLLDESSMITRSMWRDLLSADVRILALGDVFQLPPVEAA